MSDDSKQRILDAAFHEFAANGKAGARMQAIAERAQVNQAMLNYYFKSKDDLYLEVVRQSALLCHQKHPPRFDEPPEEQKKAILDHLEHDLRFWANNTELLHLTLHDLLAGGEGMKLALRETVGHEEARMEVDRLISGGLFRSRDPRQVILHLTTLTLLALIPVEAVREMWPGPESSEEFLNARIEAVRDLLEHGIFSSDNGGARSRHPRPPK
ncbi:MAG: TetR/AcrR family transcriptional regulator [bacterium]|nr:TetR/AcrR family transcriptional regulator [bacterium]